MKIVCFLLYFLEGFYGLRWKIYVKRHQIVWYQKFNIDSSDSLEIELKFIFCNLSEDV